MGNKPPHKDPPKLRRSELEEFSKQSLLLPTIIEQLYLHFYRISRSKTEDGVIDLSEFLLTIKKNEASLISQRIFHMFDTNSDNVINFREFILGISIFSENQDLMLRENIRMATIRIKDKIENSIRIFDLKNKQRVYLRDVQKILTSLIQEKNFLKLSNSQIKKIVSNTFKTETLMEDDEGRYWDLKSYTRMAMNNPLIFKWLSIDVEIIKGHVKVPRNAQKCFSI